MSGKTKRARANEDVYIRREDNQYVVAITHGDPPKPKMGSVPAIWKRWEALRFLKWVGEAEAARYEIHQ